MSQFDDWIEVEKWMDKNCVYCKKWEYYSDKDACKIGMKLLLQIDLSKNEEQEYFNGPANLNTKCNHFIKEEINVTHR